MQLLRSRTLVTRVVRKLKLDIPTSQPERSPSQVVQQVKHWMGIAPPRITASSIQQAVASAMANLRIYGSGTTRLIDVVYESPDPQLAADFANTLVNEYIQQEQEQRRDASQYTNKWLNDQIDALRHTVERSEADLLAYASRNGLVYTNDNNTVADERLRQLQTQLSRAQAERMTRQARYESGNAAAPETLGEILDSPMLRDQYGRLTDLRQQRADLIALLTPSHPKVKRIESQLAELNVAIAKSTSDIMGRIRTEFEAAQREEALLAAAYRNQADLVLSQGSKAVEYSVLKGEADSHRQLYESMLQKVNEAGVVTAMRASAARVVDPAEPPFLPSKPDVLFNTTLGLAGGLLFGVALAFFRQGSDRRLHWPGETSQLLNVRELGIIPLDSAGRTRRHARALLPWAGRDAGAGGFIPLPKGQTEPSLLEEGVRATATSILFATDSGRGARVLVVTSANPAEGKTTAITQLGASLALTGRKTLLIDGDIRRPRLHDVFASSEGPELAGILTEARPIEDYSPDDLACSTDIPGLFTLASGTRTALLPHLLYGTRLPALLQRLRRHFDHILIDTPPMLQLSDARIWARNADAVILMVRAGYTTRDVLSTVVRQLSDDGTPLLGTVLTCWNPQNSPYKDVYRQYTAYLSNNNGRTA
jgi:capsular exopolysaccharide synthesis family protein